METKEPLPWQQMPNEPEDHFKMFDLYLNLTPRSYETIADVFGISRRTVNTIARKWDWQRRIDLYNAYVRNTNWASLDELQQMQKNKLYTEDLIRRRALDLLDQCSYYLDHVDSLHDNPDVRSKMSFIRETAATIRAVSKLADVRPTKEAWKAQVDREQNLGRLFLNTIGMDPDAPTPKPEINIAAQILHLTNNTLQLEKSGATSANGANLETANNEIQGANRAIDANIETANNEQPTTINEIQGANHANDANQEFANNEQPTTINDFSGANSATPDATNNQHQTSNNENLRVRYLRHPKQYRHKRKHH